MGLREVLEDLRAPAPDGEENAGDAGDAGMQLKVSKRQKLDEAAAAGTRQITAFFGAAAAPAPAAAVAAMKAT